MSIIAKVKEIQGQLLKDPIKGQANAKLAIAALQAGIHSAAWETYMKQFAENTNQLMRLKATDGTLGDPTLDRRRAYLVANGVCGTPTTDEFDREVNSIDEGLGSGCQ